MSPEMKILMWWMAFGGTHILGSSLPVRGFLVRTIRLPGFKALYSVVALATFIPLVTVFFRNVHAGGLLFTASAAGVLSCQVLVFLGLFSLAQGFAVPNPLTTQAEMTGTYGGPRGILRITRHPQNLGFGLLGLGHCLANPYVGDWFFFGGFVVYGVVSAAHQDARMRRTGPEAVQAYLEETSAVPFAAIRGGRQRLALGEISLPATVGAALVFALLRWFHGSWFGGF